MAQTTIETLLPQSTFSGVDPMTVEGVAKRAASYYTSNRNLQTASWSVANFTGTINLYASLVTTPGANDWVLIDSTVYTNATTTDYNNMHGSYVWLRATATFTAGVIQYIKASY